MSNWRKRRPLTAWARAPKEDAQAASTVKLGPLRLKTLATRPAMTLESSPGMVSSLIVVRPALMAATVSTAMASRALLGMWAREGACSSLSRNTAV